MGREGGESAEGLGRPEERTPRPPPFFASSSAISLSLTVLAPPNPSNPLYAHTPCETSEGDAQQETEENKNWS
ncbi:unnamed protein product [Caenorhabditis auriculariae]|uniref:Uncharacterized protein n=1 Tax=Caenorhabditis auriculariae TaxID=2777116 RepID=A0A8S1GSX9_9PELO|nr:unnamed protein product [Caenorhabditis auriculariae]